MPRKAGQSAEETRSRILDAGRRLLRRGGVVTVTLEAVARAAGVTRQAVYLHFGSRARYLLELMKHLGASSVFEHAEAGLRDAPNAAASLRALIELRASTSAQTYEITLAFQAVVHTDPDVARLWRAWQARRLRVIRHLADRMRDEGGLRRELTPADAAALIWAVLSFENWYYLVHVRRWTRRRYIARMNGLLRRGLMTGRGERYGRTAM